MINVTKTRPYFMQACVLCLNYYGFTEIPVVHLKENTQYTKEDYPKPSE